MSDSQPKRRIGRSILAGLAGILTAVVPTIAADALLHATSLYPPAGQTIGDAPFIFATIYRTVFGLAAGYVTARLAPYRPMAHSLVLGAVGTLVAIIEPVILVFMGALVAFILISLYLPIFSFSASGVAR